MTNVKWVVRDTVYKEIKNKTILIVFVLNIIILLASSFGIDFIFDYVSSGTDINFNNEKIGMFKFFINFWTSVLCLLFGTSSIRSDEEAGILGQILTLPIKRGEYLLGRWLGASLLVSAFYIIMVIIGTVIFALSGKGFPWSAYLPLGILGNIAFVMCLILVTMGVGLFFNKLIAFLVSIIFYVFLQASVSSYHDIPFERFFENFNAMKFLGLILYTFFPHLKSISNFGDSLMLGDSLDGFNYSFELIHLILSTAFIFWLVTKIFNRKEA